MNHKIHIVGASGSGTTTLGSELSKELGCVHFDSDDYFWEKTDPPYMKKREISQRVKLLKKDMSGVDSWVLSGSLCGWGDPLIPEFDVIIYLHIPKKVRLKRLVNREKGRYGDQIMPGGEIYESHLEFIDWASKYDDGDMNIRSKMLHYQWLKDTKKPVLMLEEDITVSERVAKVKDFLELNKETI